MVDELIHIYADDEIVEIVNRLKREPFFRDISNSVLFNICLVKGYSEGIRTPLLNKLHFIRSETVSKGNLKYLLMAVAVDDAGSLDVLSDKKEYFRVCEEYAKTGLTFLESEYVQNSKNMLDELEFESLEFLDNLRL